MTCAVAYLNKTKVKPEYTIAVSTKNINVYMKHASTNSYAIHYILTGQFFVHDL